MNEVLLSAEDAGQTDRQTASEVTS